MIKIDLSLDENPVLEIDSGRKAPSANKRVYKGKSRIALPDDYVVIDVETTGLSPVSDEIIEIAALKISKGQITEIFSSLIKPRNKIDDFIANLTGITNEMVKDSPPVSEVLPVFDKFIGDSILVGHNIHFDINFLYDNYEDFFDKYLTNDFTDVLRLSRKLFKDFENHKLITLTEKFNIETSGFHRASADCEYTYKCYEYIKDYILRNKIDVGYLFKVYDSRLSRRVNPSVTEFDESGVLYKKVCVFTGSLSKLTRLEAMQIVADSGGICEDILTKRTNYLILGDNSYVSSIKNGKSNKQKKAEEYILKGFDLEILSESVFYDMIDGDSA